MLSGVRTENMMTTTKKNRMMSTKHLNDVAEIEDDNVGRVISGIAKEHKDSAKVVGEKVAAIDEHNPVLQTIFGSGNAAI